MVTRVIHVSSERGGACQMSHYMDPPLASIKEMSGQQDYSVLASYSKCMCHRRRRGDDDTLTEVMVVSTAIAVHHQQLTECGLYSLMVLEWVHSLHEFQIRKQTP